MQKNLEIIIQQVFNIEFCLMREIFLNLGIHKSELYIKDNHNRYIQTRYGKIRITFSRTATPVYANIILKKIKNFFKADLTKVFSDLRATGLTPNEITNFSKKVHRSSYSPTMIRNSLSGEILEFSEFNNSKLKDVYEIIHIDSKFIKVESTKNYKTTVMVIVGITKAGKKRILQMSDIDTESENNVITLLQTLKSRGLRSPSIFIADSAPGITGAIETVFPCADIQHCFFHSISNFIKVGINKEDKNKIKKHVRNIFDNAEFGNINNYIEEFIEEFPEYAKKFCSMLSDKYLYTYMKYDKSLHKYLRTNNLLESINQKIDIHISHSKYFNSFDHFGSSLIKKIKDFNLKKDDHIDDDIIKNISSIVEIDYANLSETIGTLKSASKFYKHLILNNKGIKVHYFIEKSIFGELKKCISKASFKVKTST
jgi:transposase-like protein